MGKSLNELANELKALIVDLQTDAHNAQGINASRYNNLKLSMDPAKDPTPHVVVNVCMSEAIYNLKSLEKASGSLGPEEKYVQRWLGKSSTVENLNEAWQTKVKNRGKAKDEDD